MQVANFPGAQTPNLRSEQKLRHLISFSYDDDPLLILATIKFNYIPIYVF